MLHEPWYVESISVPVNDRQWDEPGPAPGENIEVLLVGEEIPNIAVRRRYTPAAAVARKSALVVVPR